MVYFSDKEQNRGNVKLSMNISANVWNGIVVLVNRLLNHNYLAESFPSMCPDGNGVCGTDSIGFYTKAKACIPNIRLLPTCGKIETIPSDDFVQSKSDDFVQSEFVKDEEEKVRERESMTYDILDFIEFVYQHIGDVENGCYHDYFKHYELVFRNTTTERSRFVSEVNEIFSRNNTAFELTESGEIRRKIDKSFIRIVDSQMDSGDETIDSLLNVAKSKILSARFEERKIALEKLWDVFERCKSVYNEDKKKSVEKLLDKVSGGDAAIKKMIEEEMRQLTDIGNKFQIRHSEMKTVPIKSSYYLDYLFFRMYAFVSVLLKKNGDDR